jgi:AraC-like DNA-binding protein
MKALLFKVPESIHESFRVQNDQLSHFYDALHFHPEYQLTFFLEGTGTQFVGDNISRFQSGDMVLLGANLPHVFRSDEEYYGNTNLFSHGISVFFKDDSFGNSFFSLPETQGIRHLLEKADRGLRWRKPDNECIKNCFIKLLAANGFQRFYQFLGLLQQVAENENFEYLSGVSYIHPSKESENERINRVFDYIIKNFDQALTLEKAASLANMSETAFCRFFKQRTRKTFTEFVNEVRIGHACKMLSGMEKSISDVAYECGFSNTAYFTRLFKSITQLTPKNYQQKFRNK